MFREKQNNDYFSQFFDNKEAPTSVSRQDVQIRLGFMKKVYGILSVQLLVTTLICSTIMFSPALSKFLLTNPWLLTICGLGCLGCAISLNWYKNEYPTNMAILAGFTILESLVLGATVSLYNAWIVLQAFILTLSILVGLTIYTITSKKDFGYLGQTLASAILCLFVAGIVQIFLRSDIVHLGLSVAGAVLFSTFIIYDTHLIMKKMSPEEYVMAVVNLYLDVINLFLKLLKLLQYLQNNNNEKRDKKRNN